MKFLEKVCTVCPLLMNAPQKKKEKSAKIENNLKKLQVYGIM